MTGLTQRVVEGAYYTDGTRLAEVHRVYDLGYVQLRDCSTEEMMGFGINAFRRGWWLVTASKEAAA